jgi:peptidoglycan-associated lipoprotein
MQSMRIVLALGAALALAGCPKKVEVKPETGPDSTASTTNTNPATTQSTQSGGDLAAAEQAALQELQRLGMVIYFDYDKAEIKSEFVSVLAAHAKFLTGATTRKVRLEGHTDERGTREYNIGLGERRAQAVRRALMLQGVSEDQVVTVSYGEERPAAAGSDDETYAKNRRVELAYGR